MYRLWFGFSVGFGCSQAMAGEVRTRKEFKQAKGTYHQEGQRCLWELRECWASSTVKYIACLAHILHCKDKIVQDLPQCSEGWRK